MSIVSCQPPSTGLATLRDPAPASPPRPVTVLLVEDDMALANTLQRALEREGFSVVIAGSLAAARAAETTGMARVALVDLELPDGNGLTLLREMMPRRDRGVILLSGRDSELDRVVGLELGADDFLTKPFSMREMAARIRALLRRLEEPELPAGQSLTAAGVLLDPNRQRLVGAEGQVQRLTGAEAGLLAIMLASPDHTASRVVVAQQVLGYALQPQQRGVDQFASSLRQKLQKASQGRIQLSAVRGRGYRLVW